MQFQSLIAGISLFILLPLFSCSSISFKNKNDCLDKTVVADNFSVKKIAENASKISFNATMEEKIKAFNNADCAYKNDLENKNYALILARASYILADIEEKNSLVEKIAAVGKDAIESLDMVMDSPRTSYFYATNLGLIVRTQGLFGVKKIPILITALKNAQKDISLDQGGPLRSLGMLYLKTPQSFGGDIDQAIELLEKAVKTYPEHPQNHYFYAEALIEDGDEDGAKRELESAIKLLSIQKWGYDYVRIWRTEIYKIERKLK
jgi:tetratricopeptide (TPR) repeat protein